MVSDQVLAVEDIFAAGFLSQVGNEFHDPLVVGQQRLEMLKNLRKGHQVLAWACLSGSRDYGALATWGIP